MKPFLVPLLVMAAANAAAAPEYRPLLIEQREAAPSAVEFPQAVQYQAPQDSTAPQQPSEYSGYAEVTAQPAQPAVPSNVQWELYNQLQQMQQDLAELRGIVEQQTHEISQLKEQQRQRYLDLDHRLSQLKSARVSAPIPVAPPVPLQEGQIDEKALYEQAISLMRERKFAEAIAVLEGLLEKAPNTQLRPNCEYWLGELYMVIAPPNYDVAKKHFITLLRDYSDHQKVADALYKLGKLYHAQGEKDKARVTLEKVVADYPARQAARLAKQLLKKL